MNLIKNLILCLFVTTAVGAESPIKIQGNCKPGMNSLDNSVFSILLFCEGALGNYIGVVLSGHWTDAASKEWTIGDRYWYQSMWGNDVTSYYFDKKTSKLYVSTSGYYGTAGVYKLDMNKKKYTRCIWREEPKDISESYFNIVGVTNTTELDIRYAEPAKESNLVLNINKDMSCVLQPRRAD